MELKMGRMKDSIFDLIDEDEYEAMFPYEEDFAQWMAEMEIEMINIELINLAEEARERAIGEQYGTARSIN